MLVAQQRLRQEDGPLEEILYQVSMMLQGFHDQIYAINNSIKDELRTYVNMMIKIQRKGKTQLTEGFRQDTVRSNLMTAISKVKGLAQDKLQKRVFNMYYQENFKFPKLEDLGQVANSHEQFAELLQMYDDNEELFQN